MATMQAYRLLVVNEGQKRHEPGVLDSLGKHPLILGGGASGCLRSYLAIGAYELLEQLGVLVIDPLDVVLGEVADLLARLESLEHFYPFPRSG